MDPKDWHTNKPSKQRNMKCLWFNVLKPIKPPAVSVVYISCYRYQMVASKTHGLTLLRRLEMWPHTNLVDKQKNNLQESQKTWFVKNIYLPDMPYI
jgi:hypothetical protein